VIRAAAAAFCALAPVACLDREEPSRTPAPAARAHDVELPDSARTIVARVINGSTLATLLAGHGLDRTLAAELVSRASDVFDVRKIRVNQPYKLVVTHGGLFRRFEYEIDADRLLAVAPSAHGPLAAEIQPIIKTAQRSPVTGRIDAQASSLYAAMTRAGEQVDLSVRLADVFAGDVDFNTELHPGDRFDLVVDKFYRPDGAFAGYGPIQVAALRNGDRRLHAFRFAPDGRPPGYFDADGSSLKRFFLRSPLKFEPTVTSAFARRRLHPVLHEYRAHLGVDYRAPEGAPVIAVAGGIVLSAGWSGGSGRMVHLRHANGFESQYLHLSSLAVRKGMRVEQGQTIGRVGSTGLASGPHLDYRLKQHGAYINPVAAHRQTPPGDPIPPDQMTAFAAARDRALAELATTSGL
jgi:murein DD-endopeptidase MepM/ murein hydrolase activator NlpD